MDPNHLHDNTIVISLSGTKFMVNIELILAAPETVLKKQCEEIYPQLKATNKFGKQIGVELYADRNPEFFQLVLDWHRYGHKTPGYVPEDLSPSAMIRLKEEFAFWGIPYEFK